MDIVLIGHVMCHVTIFLKVLNNWQIGGGFQERNPAIAFFLIHIKEIFNTSRLECSIKKITRENILNAQI